MVMMLVPTSEFAYRNGSFACRQRQFAVLCAFPFYSKEFLMYVHVLQALRRKCDKHILGPSQEAQKTCITTQSSEPNVVGNIKVQATRKTRVGQFWYSGGCTVVQLYSCPVVQLSSCTVVQLSSCPVVQLSCCPDVQLSSCTIVQLWHPGKPRLKAVLRPSVILQAAVTCVEGMYLLTTIDKW
jgi:hypothetical protein